MKKIVFKHHMDCPYIRPTDLSSKAAICIKYGNYIDQLEPIPEWCRLEEEKDQVAPVCKNCMELYGEYHRCLHDD